MAEARSTDSTSVDGLGAPAGYSPLALRFLWRRDLFRVQPRSDGSPNLLGHRHAVSLAYQSQPGEQVLINPKCRDATYHLELHRNTSKYIPSRHTVVVSHEPDGAVRL